MEVSLIIPVYNEEDTIKKVVKDSIKVLKKNKYKYEIIVIDDASQDKTNIIIKNLEVKSIRHLENMGVGAARKTGILAARYNNIVMIDGDTTYPVNVIPQLLDNLKNYDMVIGARTSEQGTLKRIRIFTKTLICKLAEFISGSKIKDLNSGLRAFKKEHVLKFFNILPNTHSWVSTLTLCYLCNYYSIKYIPIQYFKRKGKSTFHIIKDTYNYISLIFRTIMYFYPLKFFTPISILIMSYGITMALYHGFKNKIIRSDIIIITIGSFIAILGLLADLIVKSTKNQYFKWNNNS